MSDPFSAWQNETLQGLPCRVLLPAGHDPAEKPPLVVSLHGSGERGDDNEQQLRNGLDAFSGPFLQGFSPVVVAPQCPRQKTFGGPAYRGLRGESVGGAVVAIVGEFVAGGVVDADRVYGVGFSMGAIGLYDLFARHRDLFAAALCIAGDPSVPGGDVDAAAAALDGLAITAVCGADDDIVPKDNTVALAERLAGAGTAGGARGFRYVEIAGAGHDVWRPAFYSQPELWTWLFAQKRA